MEDARDDTGQSPGATRAGEGIPIPRGARRFERIIIGLLVFAALAVLLRLTWAGVDPVAWALLGAGAGLGVTALIGWRILGLIERGHDRLRPLAWLAFPMAFFGSLAMVPLLALAIHPRVRVWLDPQSLITARYHAERLELVFPRDMRGEVINVKLGTTSIPPEHFAAFPEHGEWRDNSAFHPDHRILSLDIEALVKQFQIDVWPSRVGINANNAAGVKQIFDANRERVPQQWVDLPER